jgi:hypothetical protein
MLPMRRAAMTLALAVPTTVSIPVPAQAQTPRIDVPVYIEASDGQAANCSLGQIVGLDPKGDGFLSVRSGPGGRPYREIDRLYNGQEVNMCGQQGPWIAVVYQGSRPAPRHCNVHVPSPVRWAYTGPCRYGWIHQRYVRVIAG